MDQEKLQREVEIAQEVQAQLFPKVLPELATLGYVGSCRSARAVGGDYYDFLSLAPGRVGIALGDIAGKGISAALLMASLQALLRSHAPLRGHDLPMLMSRHQPAALRIHRHGALRDVLLRRLRRAGAGA